MVEHLAPVVDQPRYVDGPIHFGDLSEDGTEKIVERDFSVEVDDQIVDLCMRLHPPWERPLCMRLHPPWERPEKSWTV